MTSDQFHTRASDGQAKPGPRRATLIKACCSRPKSQKKERLNYANLQDKYILILLEYKLMPQLSDQTLCYKSRRIQEYKIRLGLQGSSIQQVNAESPKKQQLRNYQVVIPLSKSSESSLNTCLKVTDRPTCGIYWLQ